ncbi:hypothetical protein J6590_091298 [Homalodisca vitripennis]|nr:hypothetical protein J6590_086165 [Homalodisca vitripennis]KAG8284963.1 hypothetical protein J6590_091298 [Homalodisca vitripennis]
MQRSTFIQYLNYPTVLFKDTPARDCQVQLSMSQTTLLHLISGCTNSSIYRYADPRLSGAAVHVSNNPLHLISGCPNSSIYRYAGLRLTGAAVHVSNNPPSLDIWMYQQFYLQIRRSETVRCSCTRLKQHSFT